MKSVTVQDHISKVLERAKETFDGQVAPPAEKLIFNMTKCKSRLFRQRMIEPLVPIIDSEPAASWLTVGDGWGQEAHHLRSFGAKVVATDIDTSFLQDVHAAGLIDRFESQNLEKLTYQDRSFDYVVAKEMLHHLSRPYLGIYEMMRVARKAVVIIEPQDPKINESLSMQAEGAKEEYEARLYDNTPFFFEPVGNYIYRFSEREFEKVAYGVGRTKVAFKGLNDMASEATRIDVNNDQEGFKKLLQELAIKDHISMRGLRRYEYIMAIIFMDKLEDSLADSLVRQGWNIRTLMQNPYIS
ncbi:MAG: class I SAM-dependent methyltransferase [Deltaproteobacteria bacterium]|nr:class I SAM-dependent methyltransferase [Deltaproteobacteria bacterium]